VRVTDGLAGLPDLKARPEETGVTSYLSKRRGWRFTVPEEEGTPTELP